MSETFKDFFDFLIRKLGLAIPEDFSQEEEPHTAQGSLQDFIQVPRAPRLDRFLLLDLVQHCLLEKNVGCVVTELVDPYAPGKPGDSNRQHKQFELLVAKEVKAVITRRVVAAATIIEEQARDEEYKRSVINENVVESVITDCEQWLFNGIEEKIRSLPPDSSNTIIERKGKTSLVDFCYEAIIEYMGSSHGPSTYTALVLRREEMQQLLVEHQNNPGPLVLSPKGHPISLFGIPLVESYDLPMKRGMLLKANDITLVSSPGLEWVFGSSNDELRDRDLSKIIVKYKVGLLIKRPEEIAQLVLEDQKDQSTSRFL